ncbi:MFS transporter [Maricaulaceae bacterium NA33B04]|nr:MFS transporter [Maricaulaceae bacterium NA33B04]
MQKPTLGFWSIWNISFGFFGVQIALALQGANISRIFQTMGADVSNLAIYWLAGPVTGLLVQPIVGHFSDRTWGPMGRRRPYFLAGAVLTTIALIFLPNSPYLWLAVALFWLLDASINITMEPFRAFVGDMLPSQQRTRGFAMQTIFIGTGAALASIAPWALTQLGVASTADPGIVPDAVLFSFYIGAAAVLLAVGWTIVSTKEYTPEELASFKEPPSLFREDAVQETIKPRSVGYFLANGFSFFMAGLVASIAIWRFELSPQLLVISITIGGVGVMFILTALFKQLKSSDNIVVHIMSDLVAMPKVMQRLAVVQFFSWFALFIMWVYTTPAVTAFHYGTTDTTSDLYNEGANWVGILFAVYNVVAAIWALLLPYVARMSNRRIAHAVSLLAGAASYASFYIISDPTLLWIPMIGIGMAWGSILTMPYAILSDSLPVKKMGIYMGIFNFFIVLPQMMVAGVMGTVLSLFLGGSAIYTLFLAAGALVCAAAALTLVPGKGQFIPAHEE